MSIVCPKLSNIEKEKLIDYLKSIFPIKDSFNGNSMFILPDGSFLDCGDSHVNCHLLIEEYFEDEGIFNPEDDDLIHNYTENELGFLHCGNTHYNYLGIGKIEPTDKQYTSLKLIEDFYLTLKHPCDILIETYDGSDKESRLYYWPDLGYYADKYGRKATLEYKLKTYYKTGSFSILTEATRAELINQSRKAGQYKDGSGNRWTEKNKCKIANTVSDYNNIDMDTFWKKDILKFGIRVEGETDTYIVTILFKDILKEIQDQIKRNKNKLDAKIIYDALMRAITRSDVLVGCTCPDYNYRFRYWATQKGYNAGDQENREAKLTNPDNDKGAVCKHILAVLNNAEWLKKIASVIHNYVNYCKDHMEYNYSRFIFPKLYNMTYDKAVQLTFDDYDENGEIKDTMKSDEEIINLSNALGKVRGRFKKGSNKNPVTQNDKK